ncbi:MAG: hypothetical protein ABIG44_12845 [Planctomycetota bacterium]
MTLLMGGSQTKAEPSARAGDEVIWAIRCVAFTGDDHHKRATGCQEALKKVKGLKSKDVQVINVGHESVVYYGRYQRKIDQKTQKTSFKPDALPTLDLIRSLSMTIDGRLVFPFIYATMEELPTSRTSNPEWDLTDAEGYWSLHVAVFYNEGVITNRRFLAEEYCRELRSQGEQAYYHHGPVRSSVFVGLFPRLAVQAFQQKDPLTGAVSVTNRIVDERLLELQRRFPHSLQNAHRMFDIIRDPKTGEVKDRVPQASFVVKVPRTKKESDKNK